jgi:hypothetical protein
LNKLDIWLNTENQPNLEDGEKIEYILKEQKIKFSFEEPIWESERVLKQSEENQFWPEK